MKTRIKNIIQRNGFTLVEVMVATVLLSLVLTLSFSALYAGSHSWQSGEARINRNEDLRIGLEFIRKYVSQMSPMMQNDENELVSLFKGERESIHFISSLPAHIGGSGLNLISLVVDEDEEEQSNLYVMYQPALPGIELDANFEDSNTSMVELLSGIESIQFQYYGNTENNELPEWHESWEDQELFPYSIKLDIQPTHESQYIPTLTIPIRIKDVQGMNQFVMNTTATNEPTRPTQRNRNASSVAGMGVGGIPGEEGNLSGSMGGGRRGGRGNVSDGFRQGGMGFGGGMGGFQGGNNEF